MKIVFFDMDGTLTRSRSEISEEMTKALQSLSVGHHVIVISGATDWQMNKQLADAIEWVSFLMAQNGNHVIPKGCVPTRRELSWQQQMDIFNHIQQMMFDVSAKRNESPDEWPVPKDYNDLVQDRGCQVSYSLIGHNAPLEEKEAFDPGGNKRAALLRNYPLRGHNVTAKIGGTTCIDYIDADGTKGANIARLITQEGWDSKDCLYVGDALFPKGNDESVIGVCETRQVSGVEETLDVIREILRA